MLTCPEHGNPRPAFADSCLHCREALAAAARAYERVEGRSPDQTIGGAEPMSVFVRPDYRNRSAEEVPIESDLGDRRDEGGEPRRRRIVRCRACRILVRTRREVGETFDCPRCEQRFALAEEDIEEEVAAPGARGDTRPCPHCTRVIKVKAVICKHCGLGVA